MKEDTDLEQCIKDFQTDTDPEYYKRMKAKILQEYEDSLRRTPEIPSHGIANVNLECAYPIEIGKLPPTECIEQEGTKLYFNLNQ